MEPRFHGAEGHVQRRRHRVIVQAFDVAEDDCRPFAHREVCKSGIQQLFLLFGAQVRVGTPSGIRLLNTFGYLYTDVSIYDYLKRLAEDGENISDYITIWYYF